MPRFAANLTLLFTELPYLDRFEAAAQAGFEGVEILSPYDFSAKDTRRALLANGLELVLINAPPPNYTGGEPGYAALSNEIGRFQSDIRRTLRFADELKPKIVHIMSGYTKATDALETMVSNLQWAADLAPKQQFTIEPLNPGDQPGYFMDNYDLAIDVLDRVDRPNVGLQFDSYHAHVIHGDAVGIWTTHKERIVHVQVGAAPNRSEPAPGAIDFPALFHAIDASGYSGWVSAEYKPSTDCTQDSLGWLTGGF